MIKKIIKSILTIAIALGAAGGIVWYFQNQNQTPSEEEAYSVLTSRKTKYDGIYSLTKLDKDGNNTWNGLMLYVEKDKVVACVNYAYQSIEDVKKLMEEDKEEVDSYVKEWTSDGQLTEEEALNMLAGQYVNIRPVHYVYNDKIPFSIPQNVMTCGQTSKGYDKGYIATQGTFESYNRTIDLTQDLSDMRNCNLVAGYDEKSGEVWLSKLLDNEYSIYSEGYKLIHYDGFYDLRDKCMLCDGLTVETINKLYNKNYYCPYV